LNQLYGSFNLLREKSKPDLLTSKQASKQLADRLGMDFQKLCAHAHIPDYGLFPSDLQAVCLLACLLASLSQYTIKRTEGLYTATSAKATQYY
jgi:hypothetical protein